MRVRVRAREKYMWKKVVHRLKCKKVCIRVKKTPLLLYICLSTTTLPPSLKKPRPTVLPTMQRSSATDRSCFFQHHNPIHRKSQIHPVALYHIHCKTHFDALRECGTHTMFYTSKNLWFDHMYLNLGNCIWNCLSLVIATHPIVDRHLCTPPKNDCSARRDQSNPGSTV